MNFPTKAAGIDRRAFLESSAVVTGGFVLGFYLPTGQGRAGMALGADTQASASDALVNTWLRIAPDETITILVARAEMGQGIFTAMPMLIAEELAASWDKIRVEPAPSSKPYKYTNAPFEVTGGSASIRSLWDILLKIGATARTMLIDAAAKNWNVPASECQAEAGKVLHKATNRSATYGELASVTAKLTPPANPTLKDPKDYIFVGKPMKRLDTPDKLRGTTLFGIDVSLPNMQYAAVRTSPVFGGDVANFSTLSVPKAATLVKIPGGVAVVAANYWTALKLVKALQLTWSKGATSGLNSEQISETLHKALSQKGAVASTSGDATLALKTGKHITAEYTTPFLAHATMEPMNCTAHVRDGECEIWMGTQSHTLTQFTAAKHLGLPPEKIKVNVTYLGGGFGRRAEADVVIQALDIAKAIGKPVKTLWTREEDIQHDFYRPASAVKLAASLGKDGRPLAFKARITNSSIISRFPQFGGLKAGIDFTSVEGLADIKYEVPNAYVDFVRQELGVPVGFWRSVGSSHNAYFVECFIDELAHAANKDPYQFRHDLLAKKEPRFAKVLEAVGELANWGHPPAGHYQGIAIHESFGSIVAEVAEISFSKPATAKTPASGLKVHKVFVAIDCGRYVNPDTIVAQMESCVVYGLTAALYGEITLKDGAVEQTNFVDYPLLNLGNAPEVVVKIIDSGAAPGGVGEPGTPPVAPAVVNAIFAATGKRYRSLPLARHKLI